MHRPSAMDDPDAPLGHHWQDSTHVTFGVATAGLGLEQRKDRRQHLHRREPDENRYNFESADLRFVQRPDSPGTQRKIWRCKFRTRYIHSPEGLEPSSIDIAQPRR